MGQKKANDQIRGRVLVSGLEKNFRWAGKRSWGWGEGPLRKAKCLKSLKT